LQLFIALAFAFYLLRDDDRLADWVLDNFEDETLVTYGRAVDADLQTVFFGNILNALLTGVIGAVVFSGLAAVAPMDVPVPVPILLGLLTGFASLIPIIGMKIVLVPVTLYLAIMAVVSDPQLLWFPVVFFLVTLIVVDMIPDLLIRPYVSGRNLHVGMVMFSYIFGPLVFGWYGLFLGPLLFVLLSHFARVVIPRLTGTDSTQTTITPSDDAVRDGTHTSPERGWYPTLTSETVTGQSSPSSGSGENQNGP
jgi:predicted PurR-regulated permease PerM